MFDCKVCVAKDAHITSLISQIETLKKLITPQGNNSKLSYQDIEADRILSGSDDVIVYDNVAEIEAASILNGNYDHFNVGVELE